ncbi:TetR/AcrR family transcriptional regulator [Parafrankia elaeagni]|uniref:TetR/AcrR family transcriptional regulator n=1 Tax=Parafrankia elaeagni TaxID=222534 RepID=UPI00039CBF56|nr:TetR/AcrR family transcriptional regulator [Parafrankia elaeagni]
MAATRRRGAELESAIREAVLAEVAEHGYAGTTYEGVAARAGTGKPVLYRRWPTKAEMVLAAKADDFVLPRAADTGTLEKDLKALLHELRSMIEVVGRETMLRLLADLEPPSMGVMRSLLLARGIEAIAPVIDRARARGELPDIDLPPRLLSLPLDLARHEFILTGELPDDVIDAIVEEVLLPAMRIGRST